MIILHIASITDDKCNGVNVVVPQHIITQQNCGAVVGIMNIRNYCPDGIENFFKYKESFDLADLPSPFNNPDLVVFHEVYRKPYIGIYKNLIKTKIPYVIIPHGGLSKHFQKIKWLKKKVGNLLFFERFIRHAKAVQCLSYCEKNETCYKNADKIGTNGVTLPNKQKERFSEETIRFLYIGRLQMYHKGLDLMVKAVKKVATFMRENNCVLDIYGPDVKGRLAKLNKLIDDCGVRDLITVHSPIFGYEKEKVILDSDIFIQTSRADTAPTGITTALSYGLPCILTYGTSLGELVKKYDAGWACETNVNDIANTIVNAVHERNLLSIKSENSIHAVKEEYSWDKAARETLGVYKRIVEGVKN